MIIVFLDEITCFPVFKCVKKKLKRYEDTSVMSAKRKWTHQVKKFIAGECFSIFLWQPVLWTIFTLTTHKNKFNSHVNCFWEENKSYCSQILLTLNLSFHISVHHFGMISGKFGMKILLAFLTEKKHILDQWGLSTKISPLELATIR